MLIINAECLNFDLSHDFSLHRCDVRVEQGLVAEIGRLDPGSDEPVLHAHGALLIPGLHDHHVHLASYAAALMSVSCGPPAVLSEKALIDQLRMSDGSGWLRGINYHESVAGDIDRFWLDVHGPDRPIRIQHRSGRLWIMNSMALEAIRQASAGRLSTEEKSRLDAEDGRIYDADRTLMEVTRDLTLPIAQASQNLASFGVTGINDMTPANDLNTRRWFAELQSRGDLKQNVRLSGTSELSNDNGSDRRLSVGETKVHLHESDLPDFYDLSQIIRTSHDDGRSVAIHCVTEVELVFALAALQEAGILPGDRLEHASVVPPAVLTKIRELDLSVVTQPNFVLERGDAYLVDIPEHEHAWLYRCQTLMQNNIPVAFGTDLPFGNPDPWVAMRAATMRQTASGEILGLEERITPEEALRCFLGRLESPTRIRGMNIGEPADLCLLDSPWQVVRLELKSTRVQTTIRDGQVIYQRSAC